MENGFIGKLKRLMAKLMKKKLIDEAKREKEAEEKLKGELEEDSDDEVEFVSQAVSKRAAEGFSKRMSYRFDEKRDRTKTFKQATEARLSQLSSDAEAPDHDVGDLEQFLGHVDGAPTSQPAFTMHLDGEEDEVDTLKELGLILPAEDA